MQVFFASCGALRVFEWLIGRDGKLTPWRRMPMALTVAVVQLEDGGVILVDAGFSAASCAARGQDLGIHKWLLGTELEEQHSVRAQLQCLGIEAERVRMVVATHMHLDHIGGVVDFPNAELIVSEPEWRAFQQNDGRGYRRQDVDDPARVRAVPFDAPGRWGFRGSHDLLGDGRVVLYDARGHSRGNVSVGLFPEGASEPGSEQGYMHIGDTVYYAWEYRTPKSSILGHYGASDATARNAARAALRRCASEAPRVQIVASHDASTLAGLPMEPSAQ